MTIASEAREIAARVLIEHFDAELNRSPSDPIGARTRLTDRMAAAFGHRMKAAGRAEASAWRPVVAEVAAERERQVSVEGWSQDHDDAHADYELALAAAAYALEAASWRPPPGDEAIITERIWPWDASWWKPKDPRRDLVRAAALIVAEIERLDRLPPPPEGGDA